MNADHGEMSFQETVEMILRARKMLEDACDSATDDVRRSELAAFDDNSAQTLAGLVR
jgi:hypothetical protein